VETMFWATVPASDMMAFRGEEIGEDIERIPF
jgi:hypothetical protein